MNKPTLASSSAIGAFFPDHLCDTGRKTILKVLDEEGINAVILPPEDGQVRQRREPERRAEVRRSVQAAPRRD